METPLTLNNARVVSELLIFVFLESLFCILACYIVKTAASIVPNDAPYER